MLGFGSKRRRAIQGAIGVLRVIIGPVQHFYGLPAGFWKDPYILGFLYSSAGLLAKLATNGKITGPEFGFALRDIFSVLSNQNGSVIVQEATDMALRGDPDFSRGADDAVAVHLYTYKKLKDEDAHPLVRKAAELVDAGVVEGADRRAQILVAMMSLSFMRECKERLVE